jgi:hypothetical protein
MSNVFKLFNIEINFGGLLLSMTWLEDRRGTKFSIINNERNRNRLTGPHNLPPRLNNAAYLDFLQNVLNDPVNTIEELTVRLMQTAENIRENPEMCENRPLWSERHKPA